MQPQARRPGSADVKESRWPTAVPRRASGLHAGAEPEAMADRGRDRRALADPPDGVRFPGGKYRPVVPARRRGRRRGGGAAPVRVRQGPPVGSPGRQPAVARRAGRVAGRLAPPARGVHRDPAGLPAGAERRGTPDEPGRHRVTGRADRPQPGERQRGRGLRGGGCRALRPGRQQRPARGGRRRGSGGSAGPLPAPSAVVAGRHGPGRGPGHQRGPGSPACPVASADPACGAYPVSMPGPAGPAGPAPSR